MKRSIFIFIAVSSGMIVLLGLLFPETILNYFRQGLLNWTIIISSMSMIIAILGLVSTHWKNLFNKSAPEFASIFFIIGFLLVLVTGLMGQITHNFYQALTKTVLLSVEASLLGLLSLTLAYACFSFYRKKQDFLAIVFGFSTVVFLLIFSGILSAGESSTFLKTILSAIRSLPAAGSAGILIGIALGAIITSLRALLGFIHPFDR